MKTNKRHAPEVWERAVRVVLEHRGDYTTQWETIESNSSKIGCTAETLRRWVSQSEIDHGKRGGISASECERIKELEREDRELKRARQILRTASASTCRFITSID